jgi:hypothetical protein
VFNLLCNTAESGLCHPLPDLNRPQSMSGGILTGSYQSLPWGILRELNHSRRPGVSHRDYFAWRKWGISEQQEWFSHGYLYICWHMGAIFCNWKWIKWFRRLFKKKKLYFVLRALLTTPHGSFCECLWVPLQSRPSPGRPWIYCVILQNPVYAILSPTWIDPMFSFLATRPNHNPPFRS